MLVTTVTWLNTALGPQPSLNKLLQCLAEVSCQGHNNRPWLSCTDNKISHTLVTIHTLFLFIERYLPVNNIHHLHTSLNKLNTSNHQGFQTLVSGEWIQGKWIFIRELLKLIQKVEQKPIRDHWQPPVLLTSESWRMLIRAQDLYKNQDSPLLRVQVRVLHHLGHDELPVPHTLELSHLTL